MDLQIYPVVLELVRRLAPRLPVLKARSTALGDQFERALISIPLNLSEGAYSRGKNRHARYQTAAGSAREALLLSRRRGALRALAIDSRISRPIRLRSPALLELRSSLRQGECAGPTPHGVSAQILRPE